ncbi:hypothetical protein CEXT_551731 [Caerostris extrusa]|uniref:Uncharacterized protein n=1 Tax=Caerostris extrusa TaxID=172846 RepID=A0AAV4TJD4_CAEEX|nr:hypothetical protein CEXT_551731 [Caerostris extrusa]
MYLLSPPHVLVYDVPNGFNVLADWVNGRARVGVYCAASIAIEQAIEHEEVDVFTAVKVVRGTGRSWWREHYGVQVLLRLAPQLYHELPPQGNKRATSVDQETHLLYTLVPMNRTKTRGRGRPASPSLFRKLRGSITFVIPALFLPLFPRRKCPLDDSCLFGGLFHSDQEGVFRPRAILIGSTTKHPTPSPPFWNYKPN